MAISTLKAEGLKPSFWAVHSTQHTATRTNAVVATSSEASITPIANTVVARLSARSIDAAALP